MDDRLALSITHSDGRVTRWGPDEPSAKDVPGDLTFGTSIPGGDKDLSCSLLRRIDLDYADQGLFDEVRAYGPGNRTAWLGTMAQFPRSHGQGYAINPGAVGWSAHLEDFPAVLEIYVDRDPASFADFPLDRRVLYTPSTGDFSWAQENGGLVCSLPNQALGSQTIADIWTSNYPAGVKVSKVMYRGATTSLPASWQVNLRATDAFGTTGDSYSLTFDSTTRTQTLTTASRRYVGLQVYSNGSAATPAAGAVVRAIQVATYGTHGLTTRSISGQPDGIYASDVINNLITRFAPLITVGSIEATTFAIPHLAFLEPTTPADAIAAANAYHLYDWGVYDGEFFYRAPDPDRLTWQARLSSGAHLELEGDVASAVYNGVVVNYTDPVGARKRAGPPAANWPASTALADSTDASLVDTSETNPLTAWGRRRWGILNLAFTTSDAGATAIGAAWLAERSLAQRRGTLTLTGSVTHPSQGEVPVWRVRAGDYISIGDHPASVARRVIETRYTHGQRQNVLTLDNTSFKLEAIMERIGVQLVGVL